MGKMYTLRLRLIDLRQSVHCLIFVPVVQAPSRPPRSLSTAFNEASAEGFTGASGAAESVCHIDCVSAADTMRNSLMTSSCAPAFMPGAADVDATNAARDAAFKIRYTVPNRGAIGLTAGVPSERADVIPRPAKEMRESKVRDTKVCQISPTCAEGRLGVVSLTIRSNLGPCSSEHLAFTAASSVCGRNNSEAHLYLCA